MRHIRSIVLFALVAVVCVPAAARADAYVNPWAGVNFASDVADGRAGFGVSGGAMGAGIIGGEATLGFNPSFFGTTNDFGSNTVIDVMGNVIIGAPIGGFRPYATAGLGLIRTQIDGGQLFEVQTSDNDFGWNVGAGFMAHFNDHVGVRADLRYLRTINGNVFDSLDLSNGDFHFWRTAFGLVIR